MKKWFLVLLSLPIFLASCNKSDGVKCNYSDNPTIAPAIEISNLQNYITVNAIPAIRDSIGLQPSGVFYVVDVAGTGNKPTVCSNITVNYTGTLIANGAVFDSNTSTSGISFTLGQLILGWQRGLQHVRGGGQITLYIPPGLGYGNQDRLDGSGNVIIPANSYLKFVVTLLDVQ